MSKKTKGRVLRAKDVAARMEMSIETARKLMLKPEFGAFQLWEGGTRMIYEADLNAYIEARKGVAGRKGK